MQYHVPVMLSESVDALHVRPEGVYADLTLGGGGHTRAVLERLGPRGRLLCFDRDGEALGNAPEDGRVVRVHSDFRYLWRWMRYYGLEGFDGVLADLGVSSRHLDAADRGFSFRLDGPLDMRMNGGGGKSAADIVSAYSREALAGVLSRYGEVSRSWQIAGAIVSSRSTHPISRTGDLRLVVEAALGPSRAVNKELAKVFQALRIEVNGELEALESLLGQLGECVLPGGRVVFIAYHSLEDRMIKNYFRSGRVDGRLESDLRGWVRVPFRAVQRRVEVPSAGEVELNSRARSAKMRVGERVEA